MIPTDFARFCAVSRRRSRRYACLVGGIAAIIVLAIVVSGCGSTSPAAAETPAPAATAQPASIATVWPLVGIDQAPLFDLVVTESQGFTNAERKYLRAERIAWAKICNDATDYAALATSGGDPAAGEALTAKIERRATAAGSVPSPSARFYDLHASVHQLMNRVVRMAELTKSYATDTTAADKTATATKLVKVVVPLPAEILRVTDWGIAMHFRYGGVYYAAVTTTPTTTPTAAPTSTSAPVPNPTSTSTPEPEPTPTHTSTPKPSPTLTAAETKQVADVAQLDDWLTPVVNDAIASVAAQQLPWTGAEVDSFRLNMSYLIGECDDWLAQSPAGSLVSPGFKEYQKGLSLVRKGADQCNAAAQYNNAAHQKAMDTGSSTLQSALPYLSQGLAKLQAL